MNESRTRHNQGERTPRTARRRSHTRRRVGGGILAVALLLVLGGGLLVYIAFRRPPENTPAEFLQRGRQPTTATLVVSAGASTTHASLSADYVALLRGQLGGQGYEFVNAGFNGDTSGGLLGRLDEIVACQPEAVTILIGTNEARDDPGDGVALAAFRANLAAILARLAAETDTRVAVLSLPPLGEDFASASNATVRRYNEAIREVAATHGATYLPLHESLREMIEQHEGHRGTPYVFRPTGLALVAFQRYAGRASWDAIADGNGFVALTDGIHLSDRGGAVAARLIADWLATP